MEQGAGQQPQGSERRGSQELFKDLWSQALVTMGAAEEEVKKLLERLSEVVEIKPDDVQRYRRELSDKLRSQRHDLERSVEEGLRRALSLLKVPSREEIDALRGKIDDLGARLERLSARRRTPAGGPKR
ncbi:MAG: phasin family protein [Myxococcales bacterium]